MLKKVLQYKWIISAVLCFALLYVLPETFIEQYYSRGFFLIVRKFFDYTFAFLPFPAYYLFILFCILIVLRWVLGFFRLNPLHFLLRIKNVLSFAGFMITLFFLIWGFNYGRIPVEKYMQIPIDSITIDDLLVEIDTITTELHAERLKLKEDTSPLPQIVFINNIEDKSRDALNAQLEKYNYPNSKKIRGRFVLDNMFLVFSISGQYMPYVGEGTVDDAVYYSKKPFDLMHELAHGNGIAGEADCNFWAYISCKASNNSAFQYSGDLNYLLYLLYELGARDPLKHKEVIGKMPDVIQRDLNDIKQYDKEHTFFTGFLGDVFNTIYLKTMGVKDGVKNYDKMVLLVYAWRKNK